MDRGRLRRQGDLAAVLAHALVVQVEAKRPEGEGFHEGAREESAASDRDLTAILPRRCDWTIGRI